MEPIRILHVLGKLNRGGAETLIMNWCRNVDRSKIQFDFIIHTTEKCSYTDEILKLGGKVYSISAYNGANHFRYCRDWSRFFENHPEYRIVHGHVRSTASIYLWIAKKNGRIAISHSHAVSSGSGFVGFIKNCMQYPIRYIADYMWACSDQAGRYLFGGKITKNKNYKVVKNAINANSFEFNETDRCNVRRELHLGDCLVLGHVGRFTPEKNHRFLIQVFNDYHKKNSNSTLLLIGVGPLEDEIQRQIEQYGLMDSVRFLGERSDVNRILQAMDIFLFPSRHEGLGIAAIEAQASGLPVLASEYIPNEVQVTDLLCVIPTNQKDSVKLWSSKIMDLDRVEKKREKTSNKIKKAGYDILTETKKLEEDYIHMLTVRGD